MATTAVVAKMLLQKRGGPSILSSSYFRLVVVAVLLVDVIIFVLCKIMVSVGTMRTLEWYLVGTAMMSSWKISIDYYCIMS